MLDNSFSEKKFPYIQSKPRLAQLGTISSCPITYYLWEENDPHLATISFQMVVESNKVLPEPFFLQANPPSAALHKTCASDLSPSSLPLSGCAPAPQSPQCLLCNEGPQTEKDSRCSCTSARYGHCAGPAGHTLSAVTPCCQPHLTCDVTAVIHCSFRFPWN